MCIVAVVGNKNVVPALREGLAKLEYRGYDSCGIATINDDNLKVLKDVGELKLVDQKLKFSSLQGLIGIAHTRWATHGGVTSYNAHPLLSADKSLAVVHNGIISNYQKLKQQLLDKGYSFSSDTDSEVIANLLQELAQKTGDLASALVELHQLVDGCYALAVISRHDPKRLYAARHLLPLILGLAAETKYVCSDASCFLPYTDQAMLLKDGEYVVLSADDYKLYPLLKSGRALQREQFTVAWQPAASNKGKFEHFMLKEIYDQPQAVLNVLELEQAAINRLASYFHNSKHNYLVGIGTTYYVAKSACYLWQQNASASAIAITSDEFSLTPNYSADSHVLFISQSGETYDTKQAIEWAKQAKMSTSAVVNSPHSTIARAVDDYIFQNTGPEISVVSTKAGVAQLIIMHRISMALGVCNGTKTVKDQQDYDHKLRQFAAQLDSILSSLFTAVKVIAKELINFKHMLCLGKGIYYPLALEAALKIKEITYIHAEGMPTGFLKHGTLALVDEQVLCLFFSPLRSEKKLYEGTFSACEEVKARGGLTLGICEYDDLSLQKKFDYPITLPRMDGAFYPLLQWVFAQLLAYQLALDLGRSIDKPRNLAKSVTVP